MEPIPVGADDPALQEIGEAYAQGNLVVVAGPAVPKAAGFPAAREILGLLLERAGKSKPSEKKALAELEALIAASRTPEAFSAAKRLLGPENASGVRDAANSASSSARA